MRSFERDRITTSQIVSNYFEHPIPVAVVKPLVEDENTSIIIFNAGMDGTISGSLYMNNDFYKNHYFVCFDRMYHGTNQNKPSQYKRKYLIEVDEVVKWVRQNLPNKKIYLLGESWGSAISFLYYAKHPDIISGAIAWNMPTKPIDPEKKTFKQSWPIVWRQLLAFILKIPFRLPATQSNYGTLSRNPVLVRAKNVAGAYDQHSFITLACWRYMAPSKRFLLKNGRNHNFNFMYIQSGQDALMDKKTVAKYNSKLDDNHYCFIPTGYHILSMEPTEADMLYKEVYKFINKKQ